MTGDTPAADLVAIVEQRDRAWFARHPVPAGIDPHDPDPLRPWRLRPYVPGEFGPDAPHASINATEVYLTDAGALVRRPFWHPHLQELRS